MEALGKLFSDDVNLKDWEIDVYTKQTVLEANQNIFNSVSVIHAEVLNIECTDNNVYAELLIHVDGKVLKVLDVLTIDENNKIMKISAYRQ